MAGQVISEPELDRLYEEAKRKYYAGNMTRKYRKYQEKKRKSDRQLMIMTRSFYK
jgi:hypothetical protein